ncbi:hypothetical protein ACH5RR_035191 [Cinchona calisaya]|uniref:Uncharacterized protein n=1 Tax=Cinchona calisaya TaxID=153742 RepID=A0ABD2YGM2_9GENT
MLMGQTLLMKSYIDSLSSLLLDFPDESDMSSLGPPEALGAPQEGPNIPTAAHHVESGDEKQYHCCEQQLVWSVEGQKLSSALTVNPAFPEQRNGVICCTLNTEDTEIPD